MINNHDKSAETGHYHTLQYDETDNSYVVCRMTCGDENNQYRLSGLGTTGPTGEVSTYFQTFPHDYNIFREVSLNESHIPNEEVRKTTTEFLSTFERIISLNRNRVENSGYLPPLTIRYLEDNSVLMEWIFKDFRAGFSIEPIQRESSWYLVSNQNLNEASYGGELDSSNAEPLISNVLSFVLENT